MGRAVALSVGYVDAVDNQSVVEFCRVGVFPRIDLGRVRVEVQPGHPGNQKNPDGDEGELPLLKFSVIFAGSSAAGFLPGGLPLHVLLCNFFLCCHR